jgi:hypothetical protein
MKLLTKDLFEAAFLLSQGMQIVRVHGNGRTVLLEFDGDDNLNVLKNKYSERKAEANVHILKQQLAEVKDIVFSVMRNAKRSNEEKVSYCVG